MTATALGLLALATVAGLDLASVLQGLLSRPVVVGTGSGLLLGDVETGLRVGVALELFALDVIPVGASRYPDFGAATMVAVTYAAGGSWTSTLGAAVGLGLAYAMVAGRTIPLLRRWNARTVEAHAAALAAGDAATVRTVHLRCLGHDLVRSIGLAAAGLAVAAALVAIDVRPDPGLGEWLSTVAIGGGIWAAVHGASATARGGARRSWALGGMALGILLVLA